jgi:hypothetical protein
VVLAAFNLGHHADATIARRGGRPVVVHADEPFQVQAIAHHRHAPWIHAAGHQIVPSGFGVGDDHVAQGSHQHFGQLARPARDAGRPDGGHHDARTVEKARQAGVEVRQKEE